MYNQDKSNYLIQVLDELISITDFLFSSRLSLIYVENNMRLGGLRLHR